MFTRQGKELRMGCDRVRENMQCVELRPDMMAELESGNWDQEQYETRWFSISPLEMKDVQLESIEILEPVGSYASHQRSHSFWPLAEEWMTAIRGIVECHCMAASYPVFHYSRYSAFFIFICLTQSEFMLLKNSILSIIHLTWICCLWPCSQTGLTIPP